MGPAGETDAAPVAVFRGVRFRYPSLATPALAGIDLRIGRGEFVGVVGPTGAGKSTFCQTLNGIVPQFYGGGFSGDVTVAGLDTLETPTFRLARHVGMVLEDPEIQITATTVEAEVAFALENQATAPPTIRARVTAALGAVGLAGLELKHPANLSGGQKQRLAIAAAIALKPDVLVLDEPTSQLDPAAAAEVFAILRRLNAGGVTVVVASHASEELAEFARRILLLDGGRIVGDGPPGVILSETAALVARHVRPPDITRTFDALARCWPDAVPARPPVTLAEARAALPALAARLGELEAPLPPAQVSADRAPALEAEGLAHVYPDGSRALDGVDLRIGAGSFTAIVGRNGSGKSTLVRHFLNLLPPTAGSVRVEGRSVAGLSVTALARRIGYLAQNAHQQIFCDSVRAEVGFALEMLKRPAAEARAAVDRALAAMELAALADRHPLSLSRGDRLRVVIAAVLALDPRILIFDEPTTGQDWRGALAILDMLKALNARGATVVVITHHLYLLPGYAERLVVMDRGRVVREGSLAEVFYAGAALGAAGLVPPQTVRFAEEVEALRGRRPLGPADVARACAAPAGAAA